MEVGAHSQIPLKKTIPECTILVPKMPGTRAHWSMKPGTHARLSLHILFYTHY